jgi:DNA-binding NarL/FixJ family response regulator
MDGLAFLRALRGRGGADGQLPVVVLSAAGGPRVAFEAGTLGACEYFVKSRVSFEEMVGRVDQILGQVGKATSPAADAAAPTATSPAAGTERPGGAPRPAKARAAAAMLPPLDPRLVHVMCPRKPCGRLMSVDPALRGTSVTCKHCGGPLRVPAGKAEGRAPGATTRG